MKFIWLITNLLIIILILVRIPNNVGLTNFSTKSNFFGSVSSGEKFLNSITWILILGYIFLAFKFNFTV